MSLANEEYGKVIRTYRGKGNLKLKNDNELPCQITIQQVETGLIYITCKLAPKVAQATSLIQSIMNFSTQEIENVYGKTKDGMCFKSQEKLYIIHAEIALFSNKSSRLRLLAQEVELWSENKDHAKYYKFSVVNFEFTGNHTAKKVIQDGPKQVEQFSRNLVLKTPWGIAVVNPMPDYDDLIRRIKAQKGISVTCEVIVELSVSMGLREVASKLDELCRLLSLSRGTKITWINAEEYIEDGKACEIIIRNAVAWPFSSFPLIYPRELSDTALFIEKAYPTYLKLRDRYNLDVAIEQYLDAKRETAYLETRGLAAVALIDSLQQLYASENGFAEIVKCFGQKRNMVREGMKSMMKSAFPAIKDDELHEVLQKLPELNRRSFLNLLKKWVYALGLQIPDSELTAVKDTRNSLAHKICFKSTDQKGKKREYFRLINLIDQVFLKLLGYDGRFIGINLDTLRFERNMLNHDGSIRKQERV